MKELCRLIGGSHLYGLNTVKSDIDERYIFIHDDIANTIGLNRFEHQDHRVEGVDEFGFEVRHYLNLLRKTNTQVLEILYAPKSSFIQLDPQFEELFIKERKRLLDTKRLYTSLKGYIFGERRLFNGERMGRLGEARKEAIDKFGYSPKNFAHLIRLCHCGMTFILSGGDYYPTNIKEYKPELADTLIDIKLNPQNYDKQWLNEQVDLAEMFLDSIFESRDQSKDLKYDEEYANSCLLSLYFPVLEELYKNEITRNKRG